jgi:hypothetical protein
MVVIFVKKANAEKQAIKQGRNARCKRNSTFKISLFFVVRHSKRSIESKRFGRTVGIVSSRKMCDPRAQQDCFFRVRESKVAALTNKPSE